MENMTNKMTHAVFNQSPGLLHCHFCGEFPIFCEGFYTQYIMCSNKSCEAMSKSDKNAKEVIDAWNKRHKKLPDVEADLENFLLEGKKHGFDSIPIDDVLKKTQGAAMSITTNNDIQQGYIEQTERIKKIRFKLEQLSSDIHGLVANGNDLISGKWILDKIKEIRGE